jgi:hypothetical protein
LTRTLFRGAVPALAGAALLLSSCGPPAIRIGSVPFPTERPVLADAYGSPAAALPPPPTDARLLVLDLPWCTPCDGAWESVATAVNSFPPGTVTVYRLLFDRERILDATGTEKEVPPVRLPPRPASVSAETYHVLPGPFRESFEAERGPVFLLLDRKGKVTGRWSGFHPALADDLASGIRSLAAPGLTPAPAR